MTSRFLLASVVSVVLILTGCQQAPSAPDPQESQVGFNNPVHEFNFADPMIFTGPNDSYWAVATNGNFSNVQMLSSTDLINWTEQPDALPELPDWSLPGKVWAPEVAVHDDGRYLLYYTTRAPDPQIQCVSVAVAETPGGPYRDTSSEPLICETDQGGSIDAHPFTDDDGTRYLYWKNDGNAVGVDTWISVQRLSDDGLTLTGEPKKLIKQDQPWEGNLVEAPFLWLQDGRYHLFYSGNGFASPEYAVGHAVADNPLGPFRKTPDPILVGNEVAEGPGHCSLFAAKDGKVWMVYHAWHPGEVGTDIPGRTMWLSEVTFDGDQVSVVPPTKDYPRAP
jgi:beta-xylosidase